MTTTDLRCPQCGALVRTELLWCGLCHADLRPQPPAAPPVAPEPAAPPVPPEYAAPAPAPARTGGKHAKPSQPAAHAGGSSALDTSDLPPEVLAQLGLAIPAPDLAGGDDLDSAFAVLRAEHRDPFLTRVENATATGGGKVAVIVGGSVALTALILLVFLVVGVVAI